MQIIFRKIIVASITGTVHSILLGLIFPAPFGKSPESHFFLDLITATPTYMMYVLPVVYTYGIVCSIVSGKIGSFLAKKSDDSRVEILVSGSLHIVFGLFLLIYSLIGAVIFFFVDILLVKMKQKYSLVRAISSLLLPLSLLCVLISRST